MLRGLKLIERPELNLGAIRRSVQAMSSMSSVGKNQMHAIGHRGSYQIPDKSMLAELLGSHKQYRR
jgi:hypothetical protein